MELRNPEQMILLEVEKWDDEGSRWGLGCRIGEKTPPASGTFLGGAKENLGSLLIFEFTCENTEIYDG
ncbi:hypothetical protein FHU41_000453 [Psychromicrobium silvestre]|uniref:Uncharacterized protein n=1 Tax=Psychromicrobium silvestre TaxID=1645614 RepID=A0A7Y9LRG3_9MICC|nr:hypothetical protein [Psychromicrobium silvestre]NYE94232.1 hypothetical protein [Psychromicrobium silvestre]